MMLKLDENLPAEARDLLRDAGHDAATVLEQDLGGAPDSDVLDRCRQEGRALVTFDTDFADIRAYPPEKTAGLVVLRLRRQDTLYVLGVVGRLLPLLERGSLAGRLWIVEEEQVRIRWPSATRSAGWSPDRAVKAEWRREGHARPPARSAA